MSAGPHRVHYSWIAGVARTELGDYVFAFTGAGALAVLAGFAALMIGRRVTPAPAAAG
jgi:hypothetical protein